MYGLHVHPKGRHVHTDVAEADAAAKNGYIDGCKGICQYACCKSIIVA